MSASPIRYDCETVDGKWAARVIIDADAFYGHGDTKEEAREDLIKVVENAASNMLAWAKEQSMIRYTLVQVQKDGSTWRSTVHESPTLEHVKQTVIAGFLSGEPRRAEDEQGRVLCGLDAKGNWT